MAFCKSAFAVDKSPTSFEIFVELPSISPFKLSFASVSEFERDRLEFSIASLNSSFALVRASVCFVSRLVISALSWSASSSRSKSLSP